MKKIATNLFILTFMVSSAFADGGFVQTGVAPPAVTGTDSLFGGDPFDVGRGVLSGTDLDGDTKQEVWVTSYANGGQIFCFEESGTDTFAFVWASAENTADAFGPRDVHTGDLDGDGKGEIIFTLGRWTGPDNPDAGIHIYEWDGTDNGYGTAPAFQVDLYDALNDSLTEMRIEGFSVGDIDGDGMDEILVANNGSSAFWGTQDGSTPYHGDRFIILSVSGGIGDFGTAIVEEYSMSPRDVNKDGANGNSLGGGSPQDIVICDTDGDGLLEAACFSWNNLAVFFIEATGANAYTIGDTTYRKLATADDWTLGASVADMNNDGKDEVYVTGYETGSLFVITDADGDATSLDTNGVAGDWTGNTEIAVIKEFGEDGGHGVDVASGFGVAMGGTPGSDIHLLELASGGNPLVAGDWTYRIFGLDDAVTEFATWCQKTNLTDFDNDGNMEIALPYKGNALTWDFAEDGRAFRLAEWDGTMVSIRDITLITPDDYKLAQNYPNPFNPSTRIEYFLPVNNTISLTIYNMLGKEIVKLVNNKYTVAGSHNVVWDGNDMNGIQVGSGTYIYELRYGNISKTRQMSFMK
jgi:hypothetical protein